MLVLSYRRVKVKTGSDKNQQVVTMIQCLDKRDGQFVYSQEFIEPSGTTSFQVETDIDQARIDVKTVTHSVQFQFDEK